MWFPLCLLYFFFNDTETTEIYTLSLHDALPIYCHIISGTTCVPNDKCQWQTCCYALLDRKSTRLNSRHVAISYAVFCLKKKWSIDFPSVFAGDRSGFHVVVGNPPFGTAPNPQKREISFFY